MIQIHQANPDMAPQIAPLIMEAMNTECCQYFAGPEHTLDDFREMMISLIRRDDSQYSYRNALVAVTAQEEIIGVCITYDGGQLHSLRKAFIQAAKDAFGRDFSNMDDETESGELYIDSLCVRQEYRGQGIATLLLKAAIDRAKSLEIPLVGLLVDKGNPHAEHLYKRVGFQYANDSAWGGHQMRHLTFRVSPKG
ncbi:GNAT family N-acetyltransferase [Prevotella sp. S7 MS 2]|uniref:GNAT family N-acetyltransferase n=1 Tax=Prevotella sp. S7 MS 2 TaxID=1287488 RepID=UPI000512EFCA|nr:GNAT family N-acetyltransferase [Prevotella sp. S7 MS 2]KGI60599.1 zinc ABC transporter permease [Prevotella sp. S7 MS 2]